MQIEGVLQGAINCAHKFPLHGGVPSVHGQLLRNQIYRHIGSLCPNAI